MKFLIVGHGRHGKTAFASHLAELLGVEFRDSSVEATHIAREHLKALGLFWPTLTHCWRDRHRFRREWTEAIAEYNRRDPARLAKDIFSRYDIYCGMRTLREFRETVRTIGPVTIYIDASSRVDYRERSLDILPSDCDLVFFNNGTEAELRAKAEKFANIILSENPK